MVLNNVTKFLKILIKTIQLRELTSFHTLVFPFYELLLGSRCSLLDKKHALCDIPKQHWFGILHHMTSACGQTCPV